VVGLGIGGRIFVQFHLRGKLCEGVGCIQLARDGVQGRAFVNSVTNLASSIS
jgi:hypothetical protein